MRSNLFTRGKNLPQPVRNVIGAIIVVLVVVLSPLLALTFPDWKYIALKVWDETVCRWARGVKELCTVVVKENLWFTKA